MSKRVIFAFAIFSFFFLMAPAIAFGQTWIPEECKDGIDNDGDGLIDYPADPRCESPDDTDEWHPSQCTDGIDNDGDGKIDAQDSGCKPVSTTNQSLSFDNSERFECSDGFDNDGDGFIDYRPPSLGGDPSCTSPTDNDERSLPQCNDGIDNDGDGKIDYNFFPRWRDPGCTSYNDDSENDVPQCSDGKDNDGDGLIDAPNDPGCSGGPADNDERNQCSDGIDNDKDGYIDYPYDDSCRDKEAIELFPSQCMDFRDNDGDGLTDYPNEPGCIHRFLDNDERNQCADGIDNDNDGTRDYEFETMRDKSCQDANDNDELEPRQCADGIDNDGDGRIDLLDSGCANTYDNKEFTPLPQCSDGRDNDGDRGIDARWIGGDRQCSSASDDDEFSLEDDGGDYFSGFLAPFVFHAYQDDAVFFASIASLFRGFQTLFAAAGDPVLTTLSVGESEETSVEIVTTNAYKTRLNIEWTAENAHSCVGSRTVDTGPGGVIQSYADDWWGNGGGSLDQSLYRGGDIVVDVLDPPQVSYVLTCYGFRGFSRDTDNVSEAVAIAIPVWNPSWSTPVKLTGPAEAAEDDEVTLYYSLYDVRECAQTAPADRTWWGASQNNAIKTGNRQPTETAGDATINVGTISADTTFSLSCTGFDNETYAASFPVRRHIDVPFFFISSDTQTIQLTLGTGSGAKSNKANVDVYGGGGFEGTVRFSASGVPGGVVPRFSVPLVSCSVDGAEKCGSTEFWVELSGGDAQEGRHPITVTAKSGLETKTAVVNLQIRKFIPAYQEI